MIGHIEQWWKKRSCFEKFFLQTIFLIITAVGLLISLNSYSPHMLYGDRVVQFGFPIAFAVITVKYTFDRNKEKMFQNALQGLLNEMEMNVKSVLSDNFSREIDKLVEKKQKGNWIGFDKKPSFTNWVDFNDGNFYLKYLPLSNFYYFFNQGFINANEYVGDGISASIMRFYVNCDYLNRAIQEVENRITRDPNFLTNLESYRQEFTNIRKLSIRPNYFSCGLFSEYIGVINNFNRDQKLSGINYPSSEFLGVIQHEIETSLN